MSKRTDALDTREKPGPKPKLHTKTRSIHYRVSQDISIVLEQLQGQLKCSSVQDALDEAVLFLARKMRTPHYVRKWR
jgi:hypothetical protein